MSAKCPQCGACKTVEAETRGGKNQGRMYNKCLECGKFISWVGEAPKPRWNPPRPFQAVAKAFGRAPFQEEFPQDSQEPRDPRDAQNSPLIKPALKRAREEDDAAFKEDIMPPVKRARPEDQFSTLMLDMLAQFNAGIKKFEQAYTKFDLLAEKIVSCGAGGNQSPGPDDVKKDA